jgi:hypothetical protein
MFLCRTAERACLWIKTYHIEAAYKTNVLLAFHPSLLAIDNVIIPSQIKTAMGN